MSCSRLHTIILGIRTPKFEAHILSTTCWCRNCLTTDTRRLERRVPFVSVSNFLSTRCHPGPYTYKGLCGKNTGRLLSEASIGDKKIKIPVCASLKWINPSKWGAKTCIPKQLPHNVCIDCALHIWRNFAKWHTYLPFPGLPPLKARD